MTMTMNKRNEEDVCGVHGVITERSAWRHARTYQGYAGTLDEWLALPDAERAEYELGVDGNGDEPGPFCKLGR